MAANANLHKAKDAKNDEFYTQLTDVSKELKHYKQHFKDKIVFCNCDDPTWSAFWKYFHLNFETLGLKKLISTHYDKSDPTYKMEYEGGDDNDIEVGVKTPLEGNGDFRNQECLDLLDECDIVVTNPPFSLFREYVACLMEHEKKFLIIGNKNSLTYKEFFPLIKYNKVWIGYESPSEFNTPNGMTKKVQGLCRWFTNMDIQKRHEKLILWKNYTPEEYLKYDNYDAINVNKVDQIPCDYDGVMGVPITFLDKFNPDQFIIVGRADANIANEVHPCYISGFKDKGGAPLINGAFVYKRVLIKKCIGKDWKEYRAKDQLEKLFNIQNLQKSESPDWHNENIGVEVTEAKPSSFCESESHFEKYLMYGNDHDKEASIINDQKNNIYIGFQNDIRIGNLSCSDLYTRDINFIKNAILKKSKKAKKYTRYDEMCLYINVIGGCFKSKQDQLKNDVISFISDNDDMFDKVYLYAEAENVIFEINVNTNEILERNGD